MKSNIAMMITLITLSACSNDSTSGGASSSTASSDASFELSVSNGMGFNSSSDRAKVHSSTNKIVGFKAKDWHFRVHGLGLPDTGAAETDRLGKNNTMISMRVEIDGKMQKVGCDPAEKPVGKFHRTELTDSTISGEFEVEFVSCDDYMTGKSVNYPDKPFVVKGRFSKFPLK